MLYFTLHLQCLPACVINVGQIKKRDFNSSVTEGALAKCTYNWILLWKGFKKCLVSECSAVEAGNQRWSDSSQQVFLAGARKTAEHPEVGLNNPKALHFFQSQQRCHLRPRHQAWPGPRLSPEETRYWSAQPRKPAAIKAMTVELYSIDRQRRGPTILFIEESSIHHSLMSDNWWQVGPCFLPWPRQTESQMDYI